MNDIVIPHEGATPSAPDLVLRPWCTEDVAALVEVFRDPALRRWTESAVENEGDAIRWVRNQEQGWAARERFGFAVLDARPGARHGRLVGHVVLKEVASGKPSAEVGYWTAAHARGRGVAPRAVEALTDWAFDVLAADGLEHLELLHQVDNRASCRVAHKSRYVLDTVLPAAPPSYPGEGHRHIRRREA
ncbi:GNAT family N-acetyltransferase [Streptomyces jietaisiensis]|uniref:GNAT family N-acetyltransferase n=1 Tax=Streptomyces griseoaurantiacus TaxID=68213 RepID=UPI002E288C50|nr:GNAT family N-acetyltransferase [Streptomyces jietaisiensis]